MSAPPRLSRAAAAIRAGVFADLQRHIDAHAARGGDLIPLQIGDTSLAPPVVPRPPEGLGSYGATAGLAELRVALAESLVARGFGPRSIDPATEVHVGVGATHALFCAVRSMVDDGDDVLLAAPYWPLAHGIIGAAGARAVEVPLTSRLYDDPSLDAGAIFEAARTPRTRAIYLITPNNPDGKVLSAAHLASIAAFARAHDLWVVADEVYADYTFGAPHLSVAALPEMAGRTVSAYSFSKSHALAGARIGAVVGPASLIAAARRVSVHSAFNVPVPMQRVAIEALAAASWIGEARETYRRLRDVAAAALAGADVRFHRADGGVYLFLDFSELLGDRPLDLLLAAAIERGVLLAPGEAFGAAFPRSARLCYSAVSEPRLLEGIARLRAAMESIAR